MYYFLGAQFTHVVFGWLLFVANSERIALYLIGSTIFGIQNAYNIKRTIEKINALLIGRDLKQIYKQNKKTKKTKNMAQKLCGCIIDNAI